MDTLDPDDTIAAIATPAGPGLRGIVRLSGPRAIAVARSRFGGDDGLAVSGLGPRVPAFLHKRAGPRTYTGQDVAEIHTVGSVPILRRVLADCLDAGARAAGPGEFTMRAYLAGRLDLSRAEAVRAVIDARSPEQLRSALDQLAGGLAGPVAALRDRLLDRLAGIEATLDFVDEADVDVMEVELTVADLGDAADEVGRLAGQLSGRDRASDRPRVALVGPPNAGKSRLFNALIGREGALVSAVAGTTRDAVTAACRVGDLLVELVDTAGVEDAGGPISRRAQRHRDREAGSADLLLVCVAPGDPSPASPRVGGSLLVATKADIGPGPDGSIATSAATGEGLEGLRWRIVESIQARETHGDAPLGARARDELATAAEALSAAAETLPVAAELAAAELRRAVDALGRIVGQEVGDDVLDRIFRRFCIGK